MFRSISKSFPLVIFLAFTTSATDISDIVFGNQVNLIPAAYGDFNSDELTDVFVLRDDFKTIDVLLGSDVEHLLHNTNKFRCHYPKLKITSIVPGDFDGDAFMDVLFTAKFDDNKIGIYINWGGSDHTPYNCTANGTTPIITMTGEPLALDYNSDMIIDLFSMDEAGNRSFWIFGKGREAPKKVAMEGEGKKLNVLHSHAFVDLNDDFAADLYLTTEEKSAEIWEHSGDKYVYSRTIFYGPSGSHNSHYGQTIFMDVELNGNLNQLIPVCHDSECRNSTIWVHLDEHYRDLNVNFAQDDKNVWGFVKPNDKFFYSRTITLRAGDFNNDGYPDLLATLQKNSGDVIQTFLLENVKNPDAKPTDRFKRTFQVQWKALAPFGENTVMGSFYDFYQDGILDVILLQKDGEKFKPLAFRNTLDYDANFVKAIVLTGLTNEKPPSEESTFGQKRRNYGTNLPGPRIKYQTTTQEGVPQHGGSCQLPQSAYMALHLPYTIFGLGRTPNFVDSIDVGLGGHKKRFQQIIPNSQIFVIPAPLNKPNEWKMQLFVTPSKIIIKSVFALLGICLIILLIILGLHIKERREDKLEKLQEAQRFHFDAM